MAGFGVRVEICFFWCGFDALETFHTFLRSKAAALAHIRCSVDTLPNVIPFAGWASRDVTPAITSRTPPAAKALWTVARTLVALRCGC